MAIKYLLDADGGFTCGDTASGYTAYSYPSSHWATEAKRHAATVAAAMLAIEATSRKWTPHSIAAGYDARNWAQLGGEG